MDAWYGWIEEAALLRYRLHQLQKRLSDRQARDLEAGSQRLIERGVRLETDVALPLGERVIKIGGGDDDVIEF